MDIQTALLGSIPPALAALAELWTPVQERKIVAQVKAGAAKEVAREMPAGPKKRECFETDVENIANLAGAVAFAASKVAMLVPTWIGFISGFLAVCVEFLSHQVILDVALAGTVFAVIITT